MATMIKRFKELTTDLQALAGGKGGMLMKMYQTGYPVPDGFVVLPSAFEMEALRVEAANEVRASLHALRKNDAEVRFAVRSSALGEDSAIASFAGEFETVLNVRTDEEVIGAISTVFQSRHSERVRVYSSVQGVNPIHQMAVVVQLMVPSEISGVLFTADPITGSFASMNGNYIHGLGEQLVAGEADAIPFKLSRPKGVYDGPDAFQKYAEALFKWAVRLEAEMGNSQDVEWAVASGKLYILQARPITTLMPGDLDAYEINDSAAGDAVWVNTNVGEAIPDVVSPFTWSVIRTLDNESGFIPGYYLWSGNICGRIYSNISHRLSAITALYGWDAKRALTLVGDVFGQFPEGMQIPVYPFSRLRLIRAMLPRVVNLIKNVSKASRNMQRYLVETPDWCRRMSARIEEVKTSEEMLSLWNRELRPYISKAWWMHMAAGARAVVALTLTKKLTRLVGTEDANALVSNLRGDAGLASLGPVVGISKVLKGEMSREDYLMQYGHRGPHEFELSIPGPSDDDAWLESQIEEFEISDIDVEELLQKQRDHYDEALRRFQARFPKKAKWLERQIAKASKSARLREAARSELIRVFRVIRVFAIKTGELTGFEDDVFFLYNHEMEELLAGRDSAKRHIAKRRENYERYKRLPRFPSVIRGRFNPFEWAKDPDRRVDYYDSTTSVAISPDSETLSGFAGAIGIVEGTVRILIDPEEGNSLQPGDILVTTTTNVGWTPLFPRVAAIVTDVGAPLSHAAIVARELGIPAVVGCGNATTRLKTGDRVLVDGGHGVVKILE